MHRAGIAQETRDPFGPSSFQVQPDRAPEACYDRLMRIAAVSYSVPVAALCILGAEAEAPGVWLKAALGIDRTAVDPDDPLLRTVGRGPSILAVPDLLADSRMRESALISGPARLRSCLGVPISDVDGEPLGAALVLDARIRPDFVPERAAILDDIASVAESLIDARRASETDPVTGCLSRRSFVDRLAREAKQSARVGRPLALALIDIDQHAGVLARFGREVAEDLVRGVAGRMRAGLRETDLLGYVGAESFALLLPFTSPARAEILLRRLRCRVSSAPVPTGAGPLAVTLSIGLSGPQEIGGRHEGMVSAASVEVCRARKEGGDRLRIAPAVAGWQAMGAGPV